MKDLFSPDSIEDESEGEMTPSTIIARGNAVAQMAETRAFDWVNERVAQMLIHLNSQMGREENIYQIKFLQGQINGVVALRRAVQDMIDEALALMKDMRETDGREQETGFEESENAR